MMILKKIVLNLQLVLLVLTTVVVQGQPTDSLHGIWSNPGWPDTTRLEAALALYKINFRTNPDTARKIANSMLQLTQSKGMFRWEALNYRLLGNLDGFQGKYAQALEQFQRSREVAIAIQDEKSILLADNNLGIIFYEQGNYTKALEHLQSSLQMAEKLQDIKGQARAYINIGNIFLRRENYDKAVEILEKAIELKSRMNDQPGIAKAFINLGNIYEKQGKKKEATDYYYRAIKIAEAAGHSEDVATAQHNLGNIFLRDGQFDRALKYFQQALDIRKKLNILAGISSAYTQIGRVHHHYNRFASARSFCQKGLELAREVGSLPMQKDACECLETLHESNGRYREALAFHKECIQIRDSIFNEKQTREFTKMELQYDFEKQQLLDSLTFATQRNEMEARLNMLISRRNRTLYLSLAALLIIGLVAYYYWRAREHAHRLSIRERELVRQRQVNEQLQAVDKLKDQFLANTSHELRTPLQGIIGLSEAMLEQSADRQATENLQMIIASGRRLSSLVNDILDFSKLKNQQISLQQKSVDLHSIAEVVIRNNIPLAKGKSLQLINDIPANCSPVCADENRLQQILFNLVGNGIKFTESGSVRVAAAPFPADANFLLVSVRDTGIGIPVNKRETIFQEFEQVDGSSNREFAGTGLGLSISKRLTEMHGGQMWVESETDIGSTFYFTLPRVQEGMPHSLHTEPAKGRSAAGVMPFLGGRSTSGAAKVIPASSAPKQSGAIQILIVDDEPVNQQVLLQYLGTEPYQITQAMNGHEALELIDSGRRFDLMLLDVMMPRMNGYQVCQQVRRKYLPSELPIIMITAKTQVQDLVQGLEIGANDYLPKPFSKQEFLARVKTQIELHRINKVTAKFVPVEFLRSLGRDRITDVNLGDQAEKEVTVLFSDIRDYTTLSETMTPQENFSFVTAFNQRMGPIIRRNRGFINQYLGDAIMAIFPHEPADALQAAIEMQRALQSYNSERRANGAPTIRIGIGLHTGPLMMGIIGDDQRLDAATISDAVNTASRIENLTKHFKAGLLLSEASLGKIPDAPSCRFLGKVVMKGKKEPVGIYECFAGGDQTEKRLKDSTAVLFERGLRQYHAGKFSAALHTLTDILAIHPGDATARFFLSQVKDQLATRDHGRETWNGVQVMANK